MKNVEYSIWTDGYNWSFWKTGGGWGEVLREYKPYKPKDKADGEGGDPEPKGKGKAPVKVCRPPFLNFLFIFDDLCENPL